MRLGEGQLGNTLQGRVFAADGSAVSEVLTIAAPGDRGSPVDDFAVAADVTGGFVVAFARKGPTGVFARRYDADGSPLGEEIRVSAPGAIALMQSVALDVNEAGDFVVSWSRAELSAEERTLHARLYRASGRPATSDQGYGVDPRETAVALDAAGNFVSAFSREGRVYGQGFAGYSDERPSCARVIATRSGSAGPDVIHGSAQLDVIHAFGGNDTIYAWGGDDVVCGGSGDDVVYAGSGKDLLVGGSGDDVLDGGRVWDFCNGERHVNADTAVACESTAGVP
jgi:hypothetical protein